MDVTELAKHPGWRGKTPATTSDEDKSEKMKTDLLALVESTWALKNATANAERAASEILAFAIEIDVKNIKTVEPNLIRARVLLECVDRELRDAYQGVTLANSPF